jgi:hypothetical protein
MHHANWVKFRTAALAAVLSLGLAACGDDSGSDGKSGNGKTMPAAGKGLPGTWKVTDAAGEGAGGNKGTVYKFDKDGKLLLGGFNKCTYTHTSPDLAFKCGTVTIKWKAELKPDGKTLVLKNAAKQVLTLTRQ